MRLAALKQIQENKTRPKGEHKIFCRTTLVKQLVTAIVASSSCGFSSGRGLSRAERDTRL